MKRFLLTLAALAGLGTAATAAESPLTAVSAYPAKLALKGTAEITASYEGKSVKVPLTAEKMDVALPLNYPNQVNPIFTKLSCSSGGCHGKIAGQNGFRLSLLGFDPAFDYDNLLKETRGRRVFPAAPEKSLILTKATGVVPHGGGKKMDPNGEEFKIVRRWIASGAPYGSPTDPTVTKITVYPEHRVVD